MKNSFVATGMSIIFSVFLLTSCSKDDVSVSDPTAGLVKIAEGYASGSGLATAIYAKTSSLYTGYQKFYLLLTDSTSGNIVNNAGIQLSPIMDMGTMQHATPFENPSSIDAVNGLFPCSVVFIMPSMGGNWSLDVEVTNPVNGRTGTFSTPLTVTEPAESKLKSFISQFDGSKFYVAVVEPSAPKVGINDFEVAVYKKVSMMSFPADSSLTIIHTPEMPTMGHGSPNNIDPVHSGNGHYKGKINFTMTGLWRINMDFRNGSEVADTTQYFDITF